MSKSEETPTPLVSVVTPSYNSLPYLQDTIASVQNQDYPAIEHIIIDGDSADGTKEFLSQQQHIIWFSEPDRGQSEALNKGFHKARGDIIGWLNADDTYQPRAVSTAVRYLQDYPEADLIYGDLRIIDLGGNEAGLTKSKPFDLNALLFSNFINQPTVFMRRRVIEELGGVDENLNFAMDRDLWLRAGIYGFNMVYLEDQVLANFRLIPGTKSFEQIPLFRLEWLKVLENAFQTTSLSGLPEQTQHSALNKTRAQYHLALMTEAVGNRDRIEMFRQMFLAVRLDKNLLINRGTWLFVGKGILGLEIDRMRKFQT